ncbi:S8 family peptidase [Aporhodopirellula aestuarii]|uniref:S8 family serine peptidase n=1 Tax=Aporhodopirellula aestuarii TaxID=2950107 RepID=A0ABT0U544_9BACT|nr:S8 family peptidase [Aporhodopirellula aestuarii]MCM2372028.1 S8 family serine peptidase [Aporhodopirellula aestuarii]
MRYQALRRQNRSLRIETLEGRRLLAADGWDCQSAASESNSDNMETSQAEVSIAASTNLLSAKDAGSTRDTARNIGAIDGERSFLGRLGWHDQSDVVQFSLQRSGDVQITLSQLNRNANLFLIDSTGNLIGRSTNPGRQNDVINISLDAGDYWLAVTSTSLYTTQYLLTFAAELRPESSPTTPDSQLTGDPNRVSPLPDVAYFGGTREWNVNAIGAPEAWAAGYTGRDVIVSVVDTGVDLDHPDLVSNLFVNPGEIAGNGIDDEQNGFVDDVSGFDFADNDNIPDDVSGHGTHVAGTIGAANDGIGATGIAPDVTILPVRVLGADGTGTVGDVAAGIRYAASLGADIINLSLGGGYSRSIDAAIQYARSLGSLVVAAAGNESAIVPGYPARFSANHDNVISVGAYTSSGAIAGFSNNVGNSGAVQVDAPGVGIFSTYVGGGYATLSGTSMASPHIAGLAALTLSSNPDLTSSELRNLLASGTVGRAFGSDAIGLADATTTVAYAAAGFTASPQTPELQSSDSPSEPTNSSVRRTSLIDVAFLEWESPADERTDVLPVTHIESLETTPVHVKGQNATSNSTRWRNLHDDFLTDYENDELDSKEHSTDDRLQLLA